MLEQFGIIAVYFAAIFMSVNTTTRVLHAAPVDIQAVIMAFLWACIIVLEL